MFYYIKLSLPKIMRITIMINLIVNVVNGRNVRQQLMCEYRFWLLIYGNYLFWARDCNKFRICMGWYYQCLLIQ